MKSFNKNVFLKIAVILLSVIITVVLMFSATYSRYITTIDKNIGFKAKSQSKILLGEVEVNPNTLINLTELTQGVDQLNGDFTLSAQGLGEGENIKFNLRVFSEKIDPSDSSVNDESNTTNNNLFDKPTLEYEEEPPEDRPPIEMTLLCGDNTYTSLESEINIDSDFYKKNQKQGICYFFYDSSDDSQQNEHIFQFGAGENSSLDFTLNAYNAYKKLDKIYIYIETQK